MNHLYIDDCRHWLDGVNPDAGGYGLIYIDPPYDTGAKFSYKDKRDDWQEWMECNLRSAYPHLREDGAVFISIDDNRLIDLCIACERVFGRANKLAIMITHQSQRSNAKHINTVHEYIVAYAKNKKKLPPMGIKRVYTSDVDMISALESSVSAEFAKSGQASAQKLLRSRIKELKAGGTSWIANYRCVDSKGRIFFPQDLSVPGEPGPLDIPEIGLHLDPLPTRKWSSREKMLDLYCRDMIELLDGRPYEKHYLDDSEDAVYSILPFYSRHGTEDLKRLGIGGLFDTPKPVAMIEMLVLAMASGRKELKVLDFFAGSGTTGQAVWQAQAKLGDSCNLSFDLVQIDEKMRKSTKPYSVASSLGIEPRIPCATKYRLDRFAALNGIEDGYEYVPC